MHALPVKFHMKSMFSISKFDLLINLDLSRPAIYIVIQMIITGLFYKVMKPLDDHPFSHFLTFFLYPMFLVFTLIFFCLASYTNPGFIIGNEQVQLAKA